MGMLWTSDSTNSTTAIQHIAGKIRPSGWERSLELTRGLSWIPTLENCLLREHCLLQEKRLLMGSSCWLAVEPRCSQTARHFPISGALIYMRIANPNSTPRPLVKSLLPWRELSTILQRKVFIFLFLTLYSHVACQLVSSNDFRTVGSSFVHNTTWSQGGRSENDERACNSGRVSTQELGHGREHGGGQPFAETSVYISLAYLNWKWTQCCTRLGVAKLN